MTETVFNAWVFMGVVLVSVLAVVGPVIWSDWKHRKRHHH